MSKNIGVDAAKLAGLQIDQNQKLRNGQMTIGQMEWWLMQTMETREELVRGELVVSEPVRQWRKDEDGVIYFSVIGEGLTGQQCIEEAKQKGISLSKWTNDVLSSPDYYPAEKGKVYEIAVLPGSFFSDDDRMTKNIRAEGQCRGWKQGKDFPPELVYLIRKKFSNREIDEMGIRWIIGMHEPIKDSDGAPVLLGTGFSVAAPWLYAYYDNPDYRWVRDDGFAFVSAQVDPRDSESED